MQNIKAVFQFIKLLPVQLVLTIAAAFVLGTVLNPFWIQLFYTVSSCLIEMLLFVLPFMVFSYIFSALVKTKNKSLQLILLIFTAVFISNALSLFTAYGFSLAALPALGVLPNPDFSSHLKSHIQPFFELSLPTLISADKAMILAIIAGLTINITQAENRYTQAFQSGTAFIGHLVSLFLNKFFIPLLPIYVFGFCLKLSYDKSLISLFTSFGKVFFISIALTISYLTFLYIIGAGGKIQLAWNNIKTMAPAGLTGFSTMSSAATMPVTLRCTEETSKDRDFTDLIIPTTTNIHMLGDNIIIISAALALRTLFGMPFPGFMEFALFTVAACVARLSCVGVPGASVLVLLPVLQNFLGFTPEMLTVITTLYVLQDPFGTASNVMGNGAFALIIQKLVPAKKSDSTPA